MPSDLNLGIVYAAVRLSNEFSPEMQKVVASAQKAGQEMQAAGRVLTLGLTAPLVGVAAAAIKTSIDFESSFAGVRKTVTATEPELRALSDGFRDLALEIPANVNELNAIGEAAGQLGIQTENILDFTDTMAGLGETTNLSSLEAASSLAKLANITGLQQDEFDNLGSSIVGLGNNFATNESSIVDFGLRIAGAGELAGLSEGSILGIGTAMSSIGVQAEAGGTAVQKVLNKMNASVATGADELDVFAATAGMTAEQFAAAFREDAAGAFESFVTGLGTQGDKSFTVMEDLGLESERVIRAFLGLANSGDLLSRAMDDGNQFFEENIALQIEAEQRYGTTESKLTLLWNRVRELGITLGDNLIPAMHSFINVAGPMLTFATDAVKWWSQWPGPLKLATLAVVALVAAVGPALLIGGSILTSWASITLVFPALGAAMAAAGLKATAFWLALSGPIGWVIAAIGAVGGALYVFREELGLVGDATEDMRLEEARKNVALLEEDVTRLAGRALGHASAALKEAKADLEELEAAALAADEALEKFGTNTLPSFGVTLSSAKAQLAQAEHGLNQMAKTGMALDGEMENWVDNLRRHVTALGETKAATNAVEGAVGSLVNKWTGANFRVEEFSAAFGRLTDAQRANETIMGEVISAYDSARKKIGPFNDELEALWFANENLTASIESSEIPLVLFGRAIAVLNPFLESSEAHVAVFGKQLDKLPPILDSTDQFAGKLDVTLGALSGQVGAAGGQAINLFTSMRQSNAALEDGEKGFGKARMGAALLSGVMGELADVVGGTAGAILGAASNIASAFATGGPVAGAIAAATEGIKGLFSLFGVSGLEKEGRKAAGAARDAIADTLNDGQMAEAAGRAGAAVHIAIRDAMIATGASIAEAEAQAGSLTNALWRAEKEGGPAVDAIRDRILGIVGASEAATAAVAAAADARRSIEIEVAGIIRDAVIGAAGETRDAQIAAYTLIRDNAVAAADAQIEAAQSVYDAVIGAAEETRDTQIAAHALVLDNAVASADAQIEAAQSVYDAWSDSVDGMVGVYRTLVDEADKAYAETLEAALEAEVGQVEAVAMAEAAREASFQHGRQMRIQEMAEESAFQAALLAIKEGNWEGAKQAALTAYAETKAAAALAFDVVVAASNQTAAALGQNTDDVEFAFGHAEEVKTLKNAETRDSIIANAVLTKEAHEQQYAEQVVIAEQAYTDIETDATAAYDAIVSMAVLTKEAHEQQYAEQVVIAEQAYTDIETDATATYDAIAGTVETTMDKIISEYGRIPTEIHTTHIVETIYQEAPRAVSSAASGPAYATYAPGQGNTNTGGSRGDDYDGFAGGTGGRFIDFGRRSTIQVHGRERIVTEDEGRREAETNAASLRGVEDRLDRLDTNLQRAIKRISTDVTNAVLTKSL